MNSRQVSGWFGRRFYEGLQFPEQEYDRQHGCISISGRFYFQAGRFQVTLQFTPGEPTGGMGSPVVSGGQSLVRGIGHNQVASGHQDPAKFPECPGDILHTTVVKDLKSGHQVELMPAEG